MKVMKFGGTSVGSVKSILSLKEIVETEARTQPVIVVVSALDGITDKLIATSQMAKQGDEHYREEFDAMVKRHHQMIDTIITDDKKRVDLFNNVDQLFDQLKSIFYGVYLIHDLSKKTEDTIVSYGERLSSHIVAAMIKNGIRMNSRDFIRTEKKLGKHVIDADLTTQLVKETFKDINDKSVYVVPGFIARDRDTHETTNLGRGGSDYTASILAAVLNAEVLEIWTDVDGFMTADPKVIKSAYTINELSYVEAMELCNFGAKVIYPPTIYPVCVKNIPIKVKNTFNPEHPGTLIKAKIEDDNKPIKGISSIKGTSLITVTGLSMVGVIGVNRRIFTTLANKGISVFMVSQASSENSTSIGVRDEDAEAAAEVLNAEFAKEIETGAMYPMQVESGLATIAIVGENMKQTPGIAGKLFGTLGRSGISVIACAQGASETNISFVVDGRFLRKSLNVLHDSFFLSEYKVLNLFICGIGTVGGMLLEQIRTQQQFLMQSRRLKLNVVGISDVDNFVLDRDGIDLDNYEKILRAGFPANTDHMRDEIVKMNIFNSVFVDCTASRQIASLYQTFLEHNISVVAANKIAASSDYDSYLKLKQTARDRGVWFRYETNVGAGLPIIGTINDLCNSGDKILKIEAILSGTLNFIFNEIAADVPFSETVRRAKEQRYSEPDPRIDLSGTDVIRKLVILTREAGYKVEQEDVEKHLFVPDSYFEGSIDDFWKRLPELDADFEARRKVLEAENKRWRFVATMENGKTNVALKEVPYGHPFYGLEGSNNIVLLTTERYKEYPMLIQGYGAGAAVTAAILGDGMADLPVERLGGKTLLQYAHKPMMDQLAREGRCGRLVTVPEGFPPGSEVANTAILGYDLNKVYEGRGPLEAASIGYEMADDDLAIRCNIITLENGKIITHNGGNLETKDGDVLIKYLNETLAKPVNEREGCERVKFITGIQYRHLLVIKGGSKHIVCAPPHDHPNEEWRPLLVKAEDNAPTEAGRLSAQDTADLINELILKSQELLAKHPYNLSKAEKGERQANSIWPWSGGYRPSMETLMQQYPQIKSGTVISAVDLIRGIGHYAGLKIVEVPGATGLADTNYEGKAQAAIEALEKDDFVFVHVEASDEAGHDGDLELKLKTIEYLDQRLITPIYNKVSQWTEPVCIAVLPDHLTPVEQRIHVGQPVPFLIWYRGIDADEVQQYDEVSCVSGAYGLLKLDEFMHALMKIS